ATAIYERVLADREEILGERHPATLTARSNLASSYNRAGRAEEATVLRERVLADREEILGERHPDTLSARANLAASYLDAGRIDEATAIRERVLADNGEVLRDGDPSTPVAAVATDGLPATDTAETPAEPVPDPGRPGTDMDSGELGPAVPVPPRGRTRRRASPYFFLSYAHTPHHGGATSTDMWVERFFQDLCGHVMAMTDLPAGVPVGFMDREMHPGESWSERLSEVLAECRVFVPLFSPRYFTSEMCGKEWYAFEQRAIQHRARSSQHAETNIVPVLWVPVAPGHMPSAAERLQFNHRYFGERYVSDGLYGLIKLRGYAEEYERAVYELAKRIVTVGDTVGLAPGAPADLRHVPNAFAPPLTEPEVSRPIQITVVAPTRRRLPEGRDPAYYGGSAQDWNPYHPVSAVPLAHVAEDLVRSLNHQAVITSFDVESGRQGGRRPPDGPEILLMDRWALQDEDRRRRLAALDAENEPWTAVIVPWNRDDGQSRAAEVELTDQLEQTMPVTMRRAHRLAGGAARGVFSLEAFGQILPQVVEAAVGQHRRYTTSYGPTD
ncbi:TIR-like protein FxsC, partial [Streptomyces sp. NPDC056627]